MEVREGYKQTEVGMIPSDWEVRKLGEVVKITSGESPSRFIFRDDGTPYFKVEQLNTGNKYLFNTPYYSEFSSTVPKGSLIFPKRGASILLNKIRILVEDSFMDTNLMTLTLSEGVENEFMFYALLHKELWRIADTTSIPQINNKHIIPFQIPLPPTKAEQTAIAAALSDADALIQSLEKLIAKKRDIKQGAMQELLKPKEGWVVKKLGEVAQEFVNGGTPSTKIEKYWTGDIPWITGADILGQKVAVIRRYITNEAVKNSSTNVVVKGNLLLVSRTGVGKLAIAPCNIAISQDFTGICAKKGSLVTEYLFHYFNFNQSLLKNQNQGTSIQGITRETLIAIPIPLPPKKTEQTRIAAILSDMDAEIEALETHLAKYRQIKQGMMQELLTGRTRLV